MSTKPTVVEIEINSQCNLACSYCPNSKDERIETGEMDPKLYEKIIDDLASFDYSGKLAFDFYNEPTIAKNFKDYIKIAREKLPNVYIEIYSNGTKIKNQEQAKEYIDLGVSKFIITKHEGLKKFEFESVYESLSDDLKKHYEYRQHEDLTLTNRGGMLTDIYNEGVINLPCQIPSLFMTITVEGNVLPCFEDFYQTKMMGNVRDNHLLDVWNNEEYQKFRKDLKNSKRSEHKICKNCNRISAAMSNSKEKHLLGEEEISALENIFNSGKLYRYQDEPGQCDQFEKEFSSYLGVEHSLLVNSGTNALVAALMAAGVGPRDEVLVPAYTFVATALSVLNVGAIPIIVNIDENLGMDLKDIQNKITDRTKAIIPVHMDGIACDIEGIQKIAKDNSLCLIEDVAQAMGSEINGKKLGSFGDFSCFSLNMDKVLTTGEGGIVSCNNNEDYQKLICLTDNGYPYGEFESRNLTIKPFVGLSMRVSELTGAMARQQFKKLPEILNRFQTRKKILIDILKAAENFKVMDLYNANEDCGVKLHLKFDDAELCQKMGKAFRDEKVLFYPPFLRRAHVAWKWMHIFGDQSEIDERRNPYKLTDKKYTYNKILYMQSIDITMKTLIIDIDMHWELDEVKALGEKILAIAKGVS